MYEMSRKFFNNSQLLDLAAAKYEEMSLTHNMTRPDGLMKSLPFEVTMIDPNGEAYKLTCLYKPWTHSVKVEDIESVTLTVEEVDAIKNPQPSEPVTEEVQSA